MSKLFEEMMEGLQEARAFMEGKSSGCRVHIPFETDVRRIRGKLKMSQQRFANAFGLSVDAVRHWESGRRVPEAAARALLIVIDHHPEVVLQALTRSAAVKAAPKKPERSPASARPVHVSAA